MQEKKILVTYAVAQEMVNFEWPDAEFYYLRTGIGKMKSTYYLTSAILNFKPDLVINIGTAGSVEHKVGDVFYCTQFVDRDLYKARDLGLSYRVDMSLPLMEKGIALNWPGEGLCNTGDSFVTDVESLEGDVVDMEAFAQAWVCEKHSVPFVSIKCVTDIIGQNSVKHWEDKLTEAKEHLANYIKSIKL
ncbi:hypothetical protein [Bacteroides propionicifaciens]|uniref:5'-methylthioadenosine/S-adenosylhomocysteine nucleosidase family protein n=1 Tax=Bacteroides propionicifaciens TaxID=392838 RepID=UPI000366DE8D|nr:hypothetical protein [Bacteroides propionicifaciens]